jgi:hypothetical protein
MLDKLEIILGCVVVIALILAIGKYDFHKNEG